MLPLLDAVLYDWYKMRLCHEGIVKVDNNYTNTYKKCHEVVRHFLLYSLYNLSKIASQLYITFLPRTT